MNVYPSLHEAAANPEIRELALGFFDGLHLGHRTVITGSRRGQELGNTAMLSFRNHPQTVLFRDQPITLITGLPHKMKILKDWGISNTILLPFDREISQKTPETFLSELLQHFPGLKSLRVGENFRFGHLRRGTPGFLKSWGQEKKILIDVIPSLLHQGLPISSSRIRNLLLQRDLLSTAGLLGRSYSLYGRIVEGEKLGSRLGFPTANLSTEDGLLLPHGVYRGYVLTDKEERYRAAINIGIRPTVSPDGHPSIEAHLPDFSGNLYGQNLEIQFTDFLRDEVKFNSPADLIAQLQRDTEQARALP